MAGVVTLLGTQLFDTNTGTHTVTATPAVSDLIVIVQANSGNTTNTAPTDNNAGGAGTYTLITSALKNTSADNLNVYVRTALISSATSTIFTAAAGTTTGGGLGVFKITGMGTAGLAAIRQFAVQANQAAAGTPAPVFSVAPLTTNPIIGAVFNGTSPATMTPRTSFTERFDVGWATPTEGVETMSRDSGETATTQTWGGTSASAFASIVVELALLTNASVAQVAATVTATGGTQVAAGQTVPTTVLVSPADTATGIALQPTLSFTGTDAGSDAVSYEVQVDTVNTFGSNAASTIDSYSESNQNNSYFINNATDSYGQSFTGNGAALGSAVFYLNTGSASVGSAHAYIYAHTGTYGSNGVPTGSALATSDSFDLSTITTVTPSWSLYTFTFSGANQITLVNGTNYCVVIQTDGRVSGFINIGYDNTTPTASGNALQNTGSWFGNVNNDVCFYVKTPATPLLDKLSAKDTGFADTTSGAGDPFNQTSLAGTWTQFTGGGATIAYDATGAIMTYPASTTSSTDGDISSVSTINLTSKGVALQILTVPSAATSADAELRLQTAANNYLRWVYEAGTLFAQYDIAGTKTTAFSVAYSSSTHKAWRIRHSGSNILWDTWDGTTWTNRASVATPITITALTVLIAGTDSTTDTSPGTFKWNNYSFGPVDPYTSGDTVSYTIQNANILTAATQYFWRVRAKDPLGTNTFGAYATTRSFTPGSSVVNASVTQVSATVTATGGTQVITAQISTSVSQVTATLTASGGTQSVSTVNAVAISQVAASVTATGGTQVVLSVSNATVTQIAATLTATGGTQSLATVNKVAISQVAATVTATGGTQTIATVNNSSVTQVHATLTATGGTQVLTTSNFVALTQTGATITATGGTQTVSASTVGNASVTQVAANVTATGGTQTAGSLSSVSITQTHATLTATGGTQSVGIQQAVAITQIGAVVTVSGGTNGIVISVVQNDELIILSIIDSLQVQSQIDSLTIKSQPTDSLTIKSFIDSLTIKQNGDTTGVSSGGSDSLTVKSYADSLVIVQ